MVKVTARIDGVDEVLKALKAVDPELRKELPKEIKAYLNPIVDEMRSTIPGDRPLSGWKETGRIGWRSSTVRSSIRSKFRASRKRGAKSREFSLASISQSSPAGAIFDMAGRKSSGNTPQGRAMIAALNTRHGGASRTLWPTLERNRNRLEDGIRAILERYADKVNRKLR